MKKIHVQDIVDVDLNLQDPDGQYEQNVKVPDDVSRYRFLREIRVRIRRKL